MGFDITFHPVRLEEEGLLVRDLLLGKQTPKQIAQTIPNCKDDFAKNLEENLQDLLAMRDQRPQDLASVASVRLGMIAGYLRPYWYARGQAVSFYLESNRDKQDVFVPLLDWLGEPFEGHSDTSHGLISCNHTGSGVIADVNKFRKWFETQDFGDLFAEEGKESVFQCVNYAAANGFQMIEVADVFGPFGHCTNPENARAHYLGNV